MKNLPSEEPDGASHRRNSTDKNAMNKALRYVQYKPRSSGELSERMKKWGYSHERIEHVIDYLEDMDYLNDRKFAELYVDEMLGKGFGYRKVRQKLFEKKLSREIIEEVLDDYPHDREPHRAVEAAKLKVNRMISCDSDMMFGKVRDFLLRRGYSREIAEEASARVIDIDSDFPRE